MLGVGTVKHIENTFVSTIEGVVNIGTSWGAVVGNVSDGVQEFNNILGESVPVHISGLPDVGVYSDIIPDEVDVVFNTAVEVVVKRRIPWVVAETSGVPFAIIDKVIHDNLHESLFGVPGGIGTFLTNCVVLKSLAPGVQVADSSSGHVVPTCHADSASGVHVTHSSGGNHYVDRVDPTNLEAGAVIRDLRDIGVELGKVLEEVCSVSVLHAAHHSTEGLQGVQHIRFASGGSNISRGVTGTGHVVDSVGSELVLNKARLGLLSLLGWLGFLEVSDSG